MNRTCTDCEQQYEPTTMLIEGVDMLAHVTICDPCSDKARKAYEKADWMRTAKLRWEEAIPEEYRRTDTSHPDYQKVIGTHNKSIKWLRSASNATRRPFLGLIGASGGCKSRIASQLAKSGIWEGGFYQWCASYRFQWACQNQFSDDYGGEASQMLLTWRNTENLIFDDIGALKSSDIISKALNGILEHRSVNRLPMIWTSNEKPEEMLTGKGLTVKERARNISRLKGYSEIIEL